MKMQTVEEQLYEIGTKVLQQAHSQLYLSMRYLEGAFSAFSSLLIVHVL